MATNCQCCSSQGPSGAEFLTGLDPCHLLTSHPSGKISFRSLEPIRRAPTSEHIKSASDDPSPSGLVAGSQSGAVVAVEIFEEQNIVFPVRVFLKLLGSSVDWTIPTGIAQEDARQPAGKLFCDLIQGHVFSRTSGTFDLEIIAVELIQVQ